VAKPLSVIAKPSEAAFRAGDSSGMSGKTLDFNDRKLPKMRRPSASEEHQPTNDGDEP
jgi:hypothetical protein